MTEASWSGSHQGDLNPSGMGHPLSYDDAVLSAGFAHGALETDTDSSDPLSSEAQETLFEPNDITASPERQRDQLTKAASLRLMAQREVHAALARRSGGGQHQPSLESST